MFLLNTYPVQRRGSFLNRSLDDSDWISFLHLLTQNLSEVFFLSSGYLESLDWALGPKYAQIWVAWPSSPQVTCEEEIQKEKEKEKRPKCKTDLLCFTKIHFNYLTLFSVNLVLLSFESIQSRLSLDLC